MLARSWYKLNQRWMIEWISKITIHNEITNKIAIHNVKGDLRLQLIPFLIIRIKSPVSNSNGI